MTASVGQLRKTLRGNLGKIYYLPAIKTVNAFRCTKMNVSNQCLVALNILGQVFTD